MPKNTVAGYLWITLGCFLLIYFGGKLILQLLGVIIGIICLFKGLQILSIDRNVYQYSMHYFRKNFR